MGSFDRGLARVLLETCRYTYGAAFHTAANRAEAREALAWLDRAGAHDAPVLLDDGRDALSTSVACVLACADKIVVAYMGTKTEFSVRHRPQPGRRGGGPGHPRAGGGGVPRGGNLYLCGAARR